MTAFLLPHSTTALCRVITVLLIAVIPELWRCCSVIGVRVFFSFSVMTNEIYENDLFSSFYLP